MPIQTRQLEFADNHFHAKQKFTERDEAASCEDDVINIGYSYEPLYQVTAPNQRTCPWRGYRADIDSVWVAVELHPKG